MCLRRQKRPGCRLRSPSSSLPPPRSKHHATLCRAQSRRPRRRQFAATATRRLGAAAASPRRPAREQGRRVLYFVDDDEAAQIGERDFWRSELGRRRQGPRGRSGSGCPTAQSYASASSGLPAADRRAACRGSAGAALKPAPAGARSIGMRRRHPEIPARGAGISGSATRTLAPRKRALRPSVARRAFCKATDGARRTFGLRAPRMMRRARACLAPHATAVSLPGARALTTEEPLRRCESFCCAARWRRCALLGPRLSTLICLGPAAACA